MKFYIAKLLYNLIRVSKHFVFLNFLTKKIVSLKSKLVIDYLKCQYPLEELTHIKPSANISNITFDSIPVWVCWFQGYEKSPAIVKACIKSIQKNLPGYKINLITIDNFKLFVDIPDVIIDKFNKGYITRTHFSDILRFYLLYTHGGLWLDATIYLSAVPDIDFNRDFFTLSSNVYGIDSFTKGRWSSSFLYCKKNSFLAQIMMVFLTKYWKENNEIIDYFLMDYYFLYLYENNRYFCYNINNHPRNGDHRFLLSNIIFNRVNEEGDFQLSEDSNKIYKLTYKISSKKKIHSDSYYAKITQFTKQDLK